MKSEITRTIFAVPSLIGSHEGFASNGTIPIGLPSQVSRKEAFLGTFLNFSQSRKPLNIPHGFLLRLSFPSQSVEVWHSLLPCCKRTEPHICPRRGQIHEDPDSRRRPGIGHVSDQGHGSGRPPRASRLRRRRGPGSFPQ